jgi:hypothetical protein
LAALPEVWFPYGGVETLVTVQAENLGTLVEPMAEKSSGETERLVELLRGPASLFVCDANPTTLELLRDLVGLTQADPPRVVASEPKKVEASVPELKGKVIHLPRDVASEADPPEPVPMLKEAGRKVFIGTARPDPLFGIVDAKVAAALGWVKGAMKEAASARKDFEPTPFEKTESFGEAEEIAQGIGGARFLTAIPRGGRIRSVLEDAPFDAIKNGFLETTIPAARGLIVGAGGRGNDDTFSAALRSVWSVIGGVKRSGDVLLLSECSEGVGSPALEMFVSGRIAGEGRRREKYVVGLEEIYYLNKLKEEYSVLLLSGLPETFTRSKLGITAARGSAEAVGRLLNKLGRNAKLNLVTRAPECRMSSA